MAKIFRTTDRLSIRIDDVTVKVSPLTFEQKTEVEILLKAKDPEGRSKVRGIVRAIQYAIKEISGVENPDGTPYELEHENEMLTDACVSDLLNLEIKDKLSIVCASFVPGIPKDFSLEGVEFADKVEPEKK